MTAPPYPITKIRKQKMMEIRLDPKPIEKIITTTIFYPSAQNTIPALLPQDVAESPASMDQRQHHSKATKSATNQNNPSNHQSLEEAAPRSTITDQNRHIHRLGASLPVRQQRHETRRRTVTDEKDENPRVRVLRSSGLLI